MLDASLPERITRPADIEEVASGEPAEVELRRLATRCLSRPHTVPVSGGRPGKPLGWRPEREW